MRNGNKMNEKSDELKCPNQDCGEIDTFAPKLLFCPKCGTRLERND